MTTRDRLRQLKLRHLRVVLAIESAVSLSQAAARLHVSAAAISKALVEVEALFDGPLFERGRGWVRPTPLGEAVIASARSVIAETDGLADVVDGLHGGYRGELAIGVRAISLHPFLADSITEFSACYPKVRIHLLEGTAAHLRALLDKGEIQLLFARLSDVTAGIGSGHVAVLSDDVVVAASAAHPLARRRQPPTWPTLVTQRWCLPVPGTMMRDHLERLLAAHRLGLPERYVETSDMTLVALLFVRADWLTLVPRRVAATYLGRGVGRILPIAVPPSPDAVGVEWNDALPLRPTARHFLSLVRQRAPQAPS